MFLSQLEDEIAPSYFSVSNKLKSKNFCFLSFCKKDIMLLEIPSFKRKTFIITKVIVNKVNGPHNNIHTLWWTTLFFIRSLEDLIKTFWFANQKGTFHIWYFVMREFWNQAGNDKFCLIQGLWGVHLNLSLLVRAGVQLLVGDIQPKIAA